MSERSSSENGADVCKLPTGELRMVAESSSQLAYTLEANQGLLSGGLSLEDIGRATAKLMQKGIVNPVAIPGFGGIAPSVLFMVNKAS